MGATICAHGLKVLWGALYESGSGISADLVLAYAWYQLASTGGLEDASESSIRLRQLLLRPAARSRKSGTQLETRKSNRPPLFNVVASPLSSSLLKAQKRAGIPMTSYIGTSRHVLNTHVTDRRSKDPIGSGRPVPPTDVSAIDRHQLARWLPFTTLVPWW
jgi:TPR repeat protein